MTQSIESRVISTIYGHGRGWAFSQKDFAHLGSRETIDVVLHRLLEKSTIRRVIRGIYDYPKYSDYRAMQDMIFGASPSWESIIDGLETLEMRINSQRANGRE